MNIREFGRTDAHQNESGDKRYQDKGVDNSGWNAIERRFFCSGFKEPSKECPCRDTKCSYPQNTHDDDIAVPLKSLNEHSPDTADAARKLKKAECISEQFTDFMSEEQVNREQDDPAGSASSLDDFGSALRFISDESEDQNPEPAKRSAKNCQNRDESQPRSDGREFDIGQPSCAAEYCQTDLQADEFQKNRKSPEDYEQSPWTADIVIVRHFKGEY